MIPIMWEDKKRIANNRLIPYEDAEQTSSETGELFSI